MGVGLAQGFTYRPLSRGGGGGGASSGGFKATGWAKWTGRPPLIEPSQDSDYSLEDGGADSGRF